MPRQARLDAPGTLHHVMVRGIEKRRIVDDGKDRGKFIARLGEAAASTRMVIYAWALLPNHAHILLRSGPQGLPAFMRRFLTGYAGDYNRRHRRHGHLFQNRYKSIVCEEDAYFQELVRYIHLNPLRAGLVRDLTYLDRFAWCGHAVVMGNVHYAWQDRAHVLAWFGRREKAAVKAYRQYVADGIPLGRRPELVGGGLIRSLGGWSQVKSRRRKEERALSDERILGGGEFVQRMLGEAEETIRHQLPADRRWREGRRLVDRVCAEGKVSLEELQSGSRREPVSRVRARLGQRLVLDLGLPQAEAARLLGVSGPAIAKSLKRAAAKVV
ncbi:MAG: transposase [candidate division NC10 bacterium]|nr:transposase [candidate division NC10 bacterium]